MKGTLALLGSGEFTKNIINVDKFLLSKLKSPRVAIFPTAAGEETTWPKWIDDGEKHYTKLGVFAKGFPVIDKTSANDIEVVKEIKNFNFFVFSGGDPGYLFSTIKDSLVWREILLSHKKGSTLFGSSAGAMVMGKKFWSEVKKFENSGELVPWAGGLGVVEFGVIPHFDYIKNRFSKGKIEKIKSILPLDIRVIGIEEDTAYINLNNEWVVKGKGKVHIPAKF